MAGASMNDIKARIKSVESTMQITKAMELVATSKLRRAKEKVERSRPYYEILREAIDTIRHSSEVRDALLTVKKENAKALFIVIAGDRGLAGGYNSNIFKMAEKLSNGKEAIFLPVGKKALEYLSHRGRELFSKDLPFTSDVGVSKAMSISGEICKAFFEGSVGEVYLIYTKFVSMITQLPVYETLLPFEEPTEKESVSFAPIIEEEPEELLMKVVPEYLGGILYSAVAEALASESGARRSAMNAANKNAQEMIDTLMLKYNRARQALITQEITEIVSGAEAL